MTSVYHPHDTGRTGVHGSPRASGSSPPPRSGPQEQATESHLSALFARSGWRRPTSSSKLSRALGDSDWRVERPEAAGASSAPGTAPHSPPRDDEFHASRSWPSRTGTSFASVSFRKRRNNSHSRSPPLAHGARRDVLRYLAVNTAGTGGATLEVLDISGPPLDVGVAARSPSMHALAREGLLEPCPRTPDAVPVFDYEGAATNRVSDFAWSGPLYAFCDAFVPYEVARGQVIPFHRDPDSGTLTYYAGIDSRFNEIGGFGGAISGRRLRDGFTSGEHGESTVDGAFRELDEESIGIFRARFGVESVRHAPTFIVDESLVILLRVDVAPSEVNELFSSARRDLRCGTRCNAMRENRGVVAASSEEMRQALRTHTLHGLRMWDKYWRIIARLAQVYRFEF